MEVELSRGNWWIALVIAGVVTVPMIYKVIKYRGLKGAAFGVPLREKIGELELSNRGLTKTKLRVHVLDPTSPGDGPHVGMEVIQSTFASWEMRPVSLTRSEARLLAEELSQAADASERKAAS
jgi:hypothetical protein